MAWWLNRLCGWNPSDSAQKSEFLAWPEGDGSGPGASFLDSLFLVSEWQRICEGNGLLPGPRLPAATVLLEDAGQRLAGAAAAFIAGDP